MKRILSIFALATASLAFACTEATEEASEESPEALTKRESTYIGKYVTTDVTVEVQDLSLQEGNVFKAGLAKAVTGVQLQCEAAPCVVPVTGEWHVTKRNGKFKLSLAWESVDELAPPGARPVKIVYELQPPKVEGIIESLDLQRDDRPPFTLKRLSCPAIEPKPPGIHCNGKWEAVTNEDGCFLGTKCVPLAPPACPQIDPGPFAMKCNGKFVPFYDAKGCLLGTRCEPLVP